ncbi:MAG: magnesium and cobalt transport protein CorA [Acidimicrobiia bacterium]|nr:magnesium and cobalt transport protein CorA [Acidimicrobiia bacterium]
MHDHPFRWVEMQENGRDQLSAELRALELPALVVEDIVEANQRAKIEDYESGLFFVVDAAEYDDRSEAIEFRQVRVYLSGDLVITVAPRGVAPLDDVRERVAAGRVAHPSAGAIVQTVLDAIVDGYDPIIDSLAFDITQVEEDVFSQVPSNPSERIYRLKGQVLAFIRHTQPLLYSLERLRSTEHLHIADELADYYRDVEDHLSRTVHQLEQFNELLTSVLEANLAQITVRQNEDMRRMSAWAAIFLVPTLMAAVWGMNFARMPETDAPWGYPLALALMVGASYALYRRLRRAGWL